jgi:hypothetical protein
MFSPNSVISIQFDLSDQDTSQLKTAILSPKGVLRGSTAAVFENATYPKSLILQDIVINPAQNTRNLGLSQPNPGNGIPV